MNKELMWSESVQQVTYEMVASEKKKKLDPQMHVQPFWGVTQR